MDRRAISTTVDLTSISDASADSSVWAVKSESRFVDGVSRRYDANMAKVPRKTGMQKAKASSEALVAALDALVKSGIGGSTSRDLARSIGVSDDLVYAWRKHRSLPSKDVALELGRLENRHSTLGIVEACKKWLGLAGLDLTEPEILDALAEKPDVPGFRSKLDEAIRPLGPLVVELQRLNRLTGIMEGRLYNMVQCHLSQISGTRALEKWVDSNRGGTALFIWDLDATSDKHDELKDRLTRLFKNWSKPLESLAVVGCFLCTREEGSQVAACPRALAEIRSAFPRMKFYYTTQLDPIAADLWFFNTPHGDWDTELRGRLLEEPPYLRDIISRYDCRQLNTNIEEWTTMVVELSRDKVVRILRSKRIKFEMGGLDPDSNIWNKID